MANKKPVKEIRFGSIKATIWENDTENGVRHAVTVIKVYKDGNDWKETWSYSKSDLLTVSHVSQLAATWINEEIQKREAQAA